MRPGGVNELDSKTLINTVFCTISYINKYTFFTRSRGGGANASFFPPPPPVETHITEIRKYLFNIASTPK